MKSHTEIMLASSKKEAIQRANIQHGNTWQFIGVYKHTPGKGNNFYEFKITPHPKVKERYALIQLGETNGEQEYTHKIPVILRKGESMQVRGDKEACGWYDDDNASKVTGRNGRPEYDFFSNQITVQFQDVKPLTKQEYEILEKYR